MNFEVGAGGARVTEHLSRRHERAMREGGYRLTTHPRHSSNLDIHIHTNLSEITVHSNHPTPNPEVINRHKNPTHIPSAPMRTLTSLSQSSMNSLNGSKLAPSEIPNNMRTSKGTNGTIRSVPSDTLQLDLRNSEEEPRRSLSKPDSPMPQSTSIPQTNGSKAAPPLSWQNSKQLGIGNGVVRKMSSEFGPTKMYTGGLHVVEMGSSSMNGDSPVQETGSGNWRCNCGHVCGQSSEGGKSTSKFIERVMSERDAYKRELAAERLKSKEANDALDFAKAKMDKIISEHESEIHEATINKTLLKRKERQLEDMKGRIDIERQRAEAASEQEKVWKQDLDTLRAQCRQKVDEAEGYAAMMEAQNNTMVRHWKNKQAEIEKQKESMQKTHQDVRQLLRKEAEKTKRLEEICDQYRADNERIQRINEAQNQKHEEYKKTTEDSLQNIKLTGAKFDRKAEKYLLEAAALRDKLRWALNVSKEFQDLPSAVDNL